MFLDNMNVGFCNASSLNVVQPNPRRYRALDWKNESMMYRWSVNTPRREIRCEQPRFEAIEAARTKMSMTSQSERTEHEKRRLVEKPKNEKNSRGRPETGADESKQAPVNVKPQMGDELEHKTQRGRKESQKRKIKQETLGGRNLFLPRAPHGLTTQARIRLEYIRGQGHLLTMRCSYVTQERASV